MDLHTASQNIGKKVIYTDQFIKRREYGIITSVNDVYVFVKYVNDTRSKAMYPNNLELGEW